MNLEERVVAALTVSSYHVTDEALLHIGIAKVLGEAGLVAEHEVKLAARDRIDFLVGDVGIEVKMRGKLSAIEWQLARYALSPRVARLLLVTTRMSYGALDGQALRGKPVRVVRLRGGFL